MRIKQIRDYALPLGLKNDTPVLILGKSGSGKSDIVKEFANNVGRELYDIRLTLYDAVDLGGLPYFDTDKKTVSRGLPDMLPKPNSGPSILFLDEINLALPSTQSAAYQLILNRRLGEYILPDNCYIVAAGNLTSDKGNTHAMAAPLRNRFTIIKMQENTDDWVDWGLQNKVHSDIIGFMKYSPQSLFTWSSKIADDENFATARSWSKYSGYMYDENTPEDIIYMMGDGCIGEGKNIEFKAFRKTTGQLPIPKDILEGKVTKLDSKLKKEISCHWSLSVSLVYYIINATNDKEVSDDTITKYIDNMLTFLTKNLDTKEFAIFSLLTYIQGFPKTDQDSRATKLVQKSSVCKGGFMIEIGKYIR